MPEEQVFEMLWDCPACGTKKLLARKDRHCPNCGSPQDPAWRYFPAEGEAVAVQNYTYQGADVICPNCQTPNSKAANFCVNCAAPLKDGVAVRTLGEQSRAEGEQFQQEDLAARRRAEREAARGVVSSARGARRGLPPWVWVAGLVGIIAVAVWAFNLTRDELVTVTGHTWQREIAVQRFGAVTGSAWCDSLPFGAYNVSSFSAVRSTRSVPDGQSCRTVRRDNGDGTYSQRRVCETQYRSEPIYDRKCNYLLNTWVTVRSARASGSSKQPPPSWPVNFLQNPGTCLGCEREGGRSEIYRLVLRRPDSKSSQFTCKVPFDVWERIEENSTLDVKVGRVAGDARCDTLNFRP